MTTTIIRREYSKETNIESLAELHPLLQRVYQARGINSSDELERSLQHLIPYQKLYGIDKAVDVLFTALQAQQRVLIVGDFDADGATSTALMVTALNIFGFKHVNYLVPNRFEYGYGLTPEIVELGAKWQPDLIVTVDNGISSCDGVATANELGIKVLVTDHHLAGAELPNAAAIVNPNQPNATFPSKALAGVGVSFYVMLAFRGLLREKNWFTDNNLAEPNMGQLLDLVALGTVADVVPLDKNNRILVHQGIQRIRAGKCRPGIKALLDIAKRKPEKLVASDLGFAIGPRLNAAGRLDDMSLGINCLLSPSIDVAHEMARQLDELNKERRTIENDMKEQAFMSLDKLNLDTKAMPIGLCLYDPAWHQGVIGILAARVKERHHRPVIAFAEADEFNIKGSARSIQGVHIRDVLDAVAAKNPGLISKFGGHAMAAGLSLPKANYEVFARAFDVEVRKLLTENDLYARIDSDGTLEAHEIDLTTAEMLRNAGPWGQAFPEPIFDGRFRILDQRIVGGKHLRLTLSLPTNMQPITAIAFNIDTDKWPNHRCDFIHAAFRLDVNEYNGFRSLQLMIEHLEALNEIVN